MLYRFEDCDPAMIYYYEATPEDLRDDPAAMALIADAVRRELEAVKPMLSMMRNLLCMDNCGRVKAECTGSDDYDYCDIRRVNDYLSHHPTETDR